MRVMCINDNVESLRRCKKSILVFGEIYNVIDYTKDEEGEFYELAEDKGYEYRTDAFAPISEIDETELIKERQSELV